VGDEDRGWYIMANALDHERITMAVNNYIDLVHTFEWSIEYLRTERPEVLTDPVARAKLAELKVDLHMMRALLVCSGDVIASGAIPTKEGSMGKIWATELGCRLVQIVLDLIGPAGVQVTGSAEPAPMGGKLEYQLWISALQRFTGGANEIQRTIVAERGLGLPRG
jgi:alkylation response protein AidB-like acyl-CoA dehydrogenase